MKILVTGATGFLGSHLCCRLLREGHQVTAFHRPASDTRTLQGLDVDHAIGDITDFDAVNRAVKGHQQVIHAAAHLGDSRQLQGVQERVNVEGTRNVVMAGQRNGIERMLHVSSVAAIGLPPSAACPANETFEFNLEHSGLTYHNSKRRAEQVVKQAADNGLDAVLVNPSSLNGPFGKRFRGSDIPEKVRHSKIVTHFSGGRNTVHVGDVVDGIISAMKHGRTGERYILGGDNLTWRRMAEMAAELLGVKRIFVPVPSIVTGLAASLLEPASRLTRRRPHITYLVHYCANRFQYYDSGKAQNQLGYHPRGYQAILGEYFAWARDYGLDSP